MRSSRTLPRLKHRSDFLRLARGRKISRPGLVLQASPQPEAGKTRPRVGFTVTKKVGNAVVRNRVKRRLRQVAADVLPRSGKPGYDYVLIGRQATVTRSFPDLLDDLEMALQMLSNPRSQNRRREPKS